MQSYMAGILDNPNRGMPQPQRPAPVPYGPSHPMWKSPLYNGPRGNLPYAGGLRPRAAQSGPIYNAVRGPMSPMVARPMGGQVHPHLAGQQDGVPSMGYSGGAPGMSISGAMGYGGAAGVQPRPLMPNGIMPRAPFGGTITGQMMINGVMANVRNDRFTRPGNGLSGRPEDMPQNQPGYASVANQRWQQQSQNQRPPRSPGELAAIRRNRMGIR